MNEQLNKQHLLDVLEKIRSEKYPDIPAGFLPKIIGIQSSESSTQAVKKIKELIVEHINIESHAENQQS